MFCGCNEGSLAIEFLLLIVFFLNYFSERFVQSSIMGMYSYLIIVRQKVSLRRGNIGYHYFIRSNY